MHLANWRGQADIAVSNKQGLVTIESSQISQLEGTSNIGKTRRRSAIAAEDINEVSTTLQSRQKEGGTHASSACNSECLGKGLSVTVLYSNDY